MDKTRTNGQVTCIDTGGWASEVKSRCVRGWVAGEMETGACFLCYLSDVYNKDIYHLKFWSFEKLQTFTVSKIIKDVKNSFRRMVKNKAHEVHYKS